MSLADGTTAPAETIRLEDLTEIAHRVERGQGFEAWTYYKRDEDGVIYTYLRVHDFHSGRRQIMPIPTDKCNEAIAHALLWVDMPIHRFEASDVPADSDVT